MKNTNKTYPALVNYGIDWDAVGHECDTGCMPEFGGCPESSKPQVIAGNNPEDGAGLPADAPHYLKGSLNPTTAKWEPKVAVRCCVCGLELTDAVSIEKGIGPVCRKKYRYEDAYPVSREIALAVSVYLTDSAVPEGAALTVIDAAHRDDSRKAANVLVLVASTEGKDAAVTATHALRLLGYSDLADKVQKRLCSVWISEADGVLTVKTAWNPAFVAAVRNIAGRRWDGKNKVNLIPVAQKMALYNALKATFPGAQGIGPKGPFAL
jgi:hypothetical protein